MKRGTILLLAVVGAAAAIGFLSLRAPTTAPHTDIRRFAQFGDYSLRTESKVGWAPVRLWDEAPPDIREGHRARKAVRIILWQGETIAGDQHVPKGELRAFLDELVSRGEIDYVVVFPAKGTMWGEVFPVLDECRKSRVKIVLLNQFEA